MLTATEPLLIVSRAGRALAESSQRAGLSTVVIDGFGDTDTRAAATHCTAIGWNEHGPVAAGRAVKEFSAAAGLVYGSGLETFPELLEPWSKAQTLYGNSPEIIKIINNPRHFFSLLDEMEIPHPDVSFGTPLENHGWLIKRAGASGGGHVRAWSGREELAARDYFQKRITGPVLSVLFLADGERAFFVGWNTQWTRPGDYVWSGAINRAGLNSAQRLAVQTHVRSLVSLLELRGLNSLDVILDGDEAKILELNPRPGATLELYDADMKHGLLHWHLQACCGQLPGLNAIQATQVRACQVVFARQAILIPDAVVWPAWCHDLPATGVVFEAGDPVCTVTCAAADRSRTMTQLKLRAVQIERRLVAFRQVV